MKYIKRIVFAVVILLIITLAFQIPKLNIISGYAAKNMASTVFIANRTATSVTENDHQVPLINLAATDINKREKSVTSSVFGLMKRKAIFYEGLGSVLLNDEDRSPASALRPDRNLVKNPLPFPFGHAPPIDTTITGINYSRLESVLEKSIDQDIASRTRTVMVIYKNHLIAERYAKGFDRNTPILGWSMTKSILATLYGILYTHGEIDIYQPTGWETWQEDDRKSITFNDLLRMQSGLEWDEDYSGISDVTRMLFLEDDMGAMQAAKEPADLPGKVWNYSSGTSNLLSKMLRERFQNYQDYLNYPYQKLVDKIGMHSMMIETDIAGNYVGSSYGWASTGDWAKFGLLYLNRGRWLGQIIFDPEWVTYITQPTEDSEGKYGAHFWLNAQGKLPDVPKDLYSANGHQGQRVYIIPSKEVVIVRTGLAEAPYFDENAFLRDILSALP
ncbi:MAG: serine hydrolase [Flavobacteriaceae bacterium]